MLEFFIKLYRNLRYTGVLLVLLFVSWTTKGGTGEPDSRILIISSYNPETSQTARNISDFIEEYGLLGGKFSIDIENMNCKSFSEACTWEGRMKELLDKNIEKGLPKLIILLGQEAWTAYWSQDYPGCPDHGRDGESECSLVTGGGYRFGELGGGECGRDE